jgi:ATP-binding cassette, subfamily B, bacterial
MKNYFRRWGYATRRSQLWIALKPYKSLLVWISLGMILQAGLTLLQPWPVRTMIDHVVENPSHGHGTAGWDLLRFIISSMEGIFHSREFYFLYQGIGLLFVIYLANSTLLYFQNISLAKLGQQVVFRIRENLFSQLISLPQSFFEQSKTGDLTSRISKDTAEVQDLLESLLTILVRSLPTVLGIMVVSFALDWIYALTFIFVIPIVYWTNVVFTRLTKDAIRQQKHIEGEMASSVQEAFYHHKAVATMSLENDVVDNFLQSGRQSAFHGVQAGRFEGILTASLDLIVGATSLLVLFVGILRIMHGCLTVGQLMVFLAYLNSLFKPIREISKFTGRIAKSAAALERVEEIMRLDLTEIGATESDDAVEAPPFHGRIELENVSFAYRNGQAILKNFNLSLKAGQRVAIVGDSGSGKSTILQLIMRLYDPQQGRVIIDGIDVKDVKLESLRKQMAIVLQDSYVFNMTLLENIAVAKPGSNKDEVIGAAKAAGADNFIRDLPDGYDTIIGEGGSGLSGGQRRRIAIARAFMRNAPIILLDEPTVGLDAASEQAVVDAIKLLIQRRTAIIVTHQLSTITDMDLIVVLSKGEIMEVGRHEDLLNRAGLYKKFWEAQQLDGLSPVAK